MRIYRNSCVVHVGAGLSTSAGIRDFRGKNGVWTEYLSKQKLPMTNVECHTSNLDDCSDNTFKKIKLETPDNTPVSDSTPIAPAELKPFDETEPTLSHMALKQLCHSNYVKQIISQNVDGLFLKAGLERGYICELHGDFYLDECTCCKGRYIRCTASKTMRLQRSTIRCPKLIEDTEKQCKGYLRDTILDWESPIPHMELRLATKFSKDCKLHICIGTSLQLSPSKDLVCNPKKYKHKKLVIINLQPTKFDSRADLVINYYADYIMNELMSALDIAIPIYDRSTDPTKNKDLDHTQWKR